ncbi:MAG: ABC-F family ATP-binding cassette domain-containing protein, partial [Cyanobacteria bacterium K_DeepCast_35m_m2_023]|nr:ABC-F family ATP-binding cassette domain-containing protein [Cyanobacteria bacterium K_DeepCast_35m_m2_023]
MSLLLSLQNAELKYSNKQILSGANWQIHTGQRFALIGRNGAGKSTLMQVLAGQITLDKGTISYQKGLKTATLPQDLSKSFGQTVFEDIYYRVIAQGGLNPQIKISDFYIEDGQLKLDAMHHDDPMLLDFVNKCNQYCRVMQLKYHVEWLSMSGGMKRRSALVAALLVEPDVLFLDEPTNHLDIQAIVWLEQYLLSFKGAVIFVTHDRYFLKAVANHIMALEFELLKQYNDGYEAYLTQRDAELAAIENENNRLKNRLAAEEHWLHRGVTARRARNQGRLNALIQLRQVIAERQKNMGMPGQWNPQIIGSGRVLFTAENVKYTYPDQNIIDDFSFILMRGDKLGIVGPNGCGKTTLAKLLLGELVPHRGSIKFSNRLEPIYFDQLQKQLNGEQTLMHNIANGAEYVELPEGRVHVAGYLKNFSFMPEQLQRPVHTLSGGEKQRLMLAKCLAKQGNLMIFDEPSNDLDLDSLEQLASMMVSYTGTFILISHDRALIEDVVTRLLVWEAPGVFKEILPSEWDPKKYVVRSNEPSSKTMSKPKL